MKLPALSLPVARRASEGAQRRRILGIMPQDHDCEHWCQMIYGMCIVGCAVDPYDGCVEQCNKLRDDCLAGC